MYKRLQAGFSIVELLIVMVLIGIVTAFVLSVVIHDSDDRTYYTRGTSELNVMANALKFYVDKYDEYPDDVNRDIPAGIKEFIAQDAAYIDEWPDAPWPGSVYDYENWDSGDTIQISIRFCPYGGPIESCNFPDEDWATGFDQWSAMYYCIKGNCRSHSSKPDDHPGYCVNCPEEES